MSAPFDHTLSPDDNLKPQILSLVWITTGIGTAFLILRFIARGYILRQIKADDWFILASYACTVTGAILITVATTFGLGRHLQFLEPLDKRNSFKYNIMWQGPSIIGQSLGRVSFIVLLLSIIGPGDKYRRWFLYGFIAVQVCINIPLLFLIPLQCNPPAALWDQNVKGTCFQKNWQEHYGYAQGSINTASDAGLVIFPMTIIGGLNMKKSLKISLMFSMSLGVFAMAGSIIKTIQLKVLSKSTDYSYATYPLILWQNVESYVIIVAATLPTLRPLLSDRYRKAGHEGNSPGSILRRLLFLRRKTADEEYSMGVYPPSHERSGHGRYVRTNDERDDTSKSELVTHPTEIYLGSHAK